VLGLNVSPLLKRFHQSKEDDRFPQMVAEFIDSVVHLYGLGVLLIPHVLHDGPNNDYTYMATVADMVGAHERVRLVPSHYNACQMKHVISKCDLLVAARTHATIAGFSSAVPTISLAYSQKAHGINRDLFGDGRWVVDSRTLTESRALVARVDEMLEGRQATSHRLRQIMPDVGARARSAVDHLASLM
jgi:polysaccharide pyruvyl transferase WcaK-like protein